MPRTFSREEFYDLVWSKPITHLAKEFVLSDVAIHKVCKKHDIPNTRTARFLELAQQQLMTMENNLNSGGLEARFERHHLFGDDDDHNFQLPYRY